MDSSQTPDYSAEYARLHNKFKVLYQVSHKVFIEEQQQRQTLAFLKRRNNALLDLLHKVDDTPATTDDDKIQRIIDRTPKLAKLLTPLLSLNENTIIDKSHFINCFIDEAVPDLLNDDISPLEINPQDFESWINRQKTTLTSLNFSEIDISHLGLYLEYIGTDCPPPEDEINRKKKRKFTHEGPKKKQKT